MPFRHGQDHANSLLIAFGMQRGFHYRIADTPVLLHNKSHQNGPPSIQKRVVRIVGFTEQEGIQGINATGKCREMLGKMIDCVTIGDVSEERKIRIIWAWQIKFEIGVIETLPYHHRVIPLDLDHSGIICPALKNVQDDFFLALVRIPFFDELLQRFAPIFPQKFKKGRD